MQNDNKSRFASTENIDHERLIPHIYIYLEKGRGQWTRTNTALQQVGVHGDSDLLPSALARHGFSLIFPPGPLHAGKPSEHLRPWPLVTHLRTAVYQDSVICAAISVTVCKMHTAAEHMIYHLSEVSVA
jgi:hypothetical protein